MHTSGPRLGLTLGITALLLPLLALGVFVTVFALAATADDSTNPLAGRSFYTDPLSGAAKAASAGTGTSNGTSTGTNAAADTARLTRLAEQPTAIWLTPEKHPLGTVETDVAAIVDDAAAAGRLPVFVIYGVPNRDCGNFSAGGLSSAEYPVWVQSIASGLGMRSAVVILEPDALALAGECGNTDERLREIRGAVDVLATSMATVYLDGGHSDWLPATEMASLLNRAGIDQVRGFATNVSNYQDSAAEQAYAETLSGLTDGAHYVVDTSRNGAGSTGEWCNPAGRALGASAAAVTADGPHDANLWIKPPGESDGTCNGGPAAGEWWNERAIELAENAGW
ncbi:MAG TPA: glycoside hydrolase family 6 protein [Cryobacterium sp.]|nr:glycoside hydrolase family 6 protein [Cryobacterium sp.]